MKTKKDPFAAEKKRISQWLKRNDMTLSDVGVDAPSSVDELSDPDIMLSLMEDVIEDESR